MTKQELRTALESGETVYVMVKTGIVAKIMHVNFLELSKSVNTFVEVKQLSPPYQYSTYHPVEDVKLLTVESIVKFKLMGIITE